MKKIERATAFLQQQLGLFRCPVCHLPYTTVIEHGMTCDNGHEMDLSKKGTLYFLNHEVSTEYDAEMLNSRRRILSAGLFDGFLAAISEAMPSAAATILDVGSGEGTPLKKLLDSRITKNDTAIGFDISKPGINLATQLTSSAFWCVADLAQLPFTDHQFDAIIDIFSPSAYAEFNRVLKPGGKLLKVVPNSHYLVELRELLYPETSANHSYSNDRVVSLFKDHYANVQEQPIRYTVPIDQDQFADLLAMTPLSWGADQAQLTQARQAPLSEITVDVTLLIAEV
ncbi:methyltransferase [Secundilactobacillus oryzae JCM 18671]|uniref:Methyltransferase n=1 Tax=Secundilactobacillus oryzae JCM 18671 TaxID=1291743 RepID=A0A081BGK8_9LACO|nr:methyltransferase domain-containing protein [Secundilactobacillus oryzae]GAK47176.1 methyltransferase [Secundilactobacillus oryzae JCM 18671]